MTTNITERDKHMLMGLGIFCVAAFLTILVILPLYGANKSMKMTLDDNESRIQDFKDKEAGLSSIQEQNGAVRDALAQIQEKLYPMLRTQDVDKLLTEKALAHGLSARRLQISMPEAPANITGFGLSNDTGSNPNTEDGVWIAAATLEVSGQEGDIDALIDDMSENMPGVRVLKINWSWDRRTVDASTGLTEPVGVLTLQLQVLMCRKD